MPIEAFAYPASVEEALAALADPARRAIPLGGGTALASGNQRGAAVLVDVTRCGLDRIEVADDAIRLGATVRCAAIADAPLPGAEGALLRAAAGGIASQIVRNAITLGGNLVHLCSWNDMPVALLALDATVHAATQARGAFALPMADFLAAHPTRVLPEGALVTGVTVPRAPERRGAAYQRFRTTATDYSLATVAAVLALDARGRCARAAIALGAVCPRPVRARRAEEHLAGGALTAERLAAAAVLVREDIDVPDDPRMPAGALARILTVVARRTLEEAARAARTGKDAPHS